VKFCIVASLSLLASAASAEPKLDMTTFFTGKSHADNVMKVAFKKPVKLIVDSVGGIGDRGDFVLIDTVHEGDKPVRTRKWIMRQVAANHFTGSLTDAVGPVDVLVSGSGVTISYTMQGGLKVAQQMTLQPDGRTLANHVIVKKFGLTFAHVDGTIRKLD
jgi:hypothetical protein